MYTSITVHPILVCCVIQRFVGPRRAVISFQNAEYVTNAVGPFRHVHATLNLPNGRGPQWFKSSILGRRDRWTVAP